MWASNFEEILRRYCSLVTPDQEIDPDTPFAALGVDSLAVVGLFTDLEDHLGTDLPDTLLTPEVFRTPGTLWSALSRQGRFISEG